MAYQNIWWTRNVEYGAGLNNSQTWPKMMEQYRKPKDERQHDLPQEPYDFCKLYHEHPRIHGPPVYHGYFRDHPQTIKKKHPEESEKPVGFHGKIYCEQGPPTFKYDGPTKNDVYWLERPPYFPQFQKVTTKANSYMRSFSINGKTCDPNQRSFKQ